MPSPKYTVLQAMDSPLGNCGHVHETLKAALQCLLSRGQDGCIRRIDTKQLTASERKQLQLLR